MSDKRMSLLAAAAAGLLVLGLAACCLFVPAAKETGGPPARRPSHPPGGADGRLVVELGGGSYGKVLDTPGFLGINGLDHYANRFAQARLGKEFCYSISGLRREVFDLEVCCLEWQGRAPGERVFTVYADGVPLPELTGIDLAAGVGAGVPWEACARGVRAPGGRVDIAFKAEAGEATVSYVRLVAQGRSLLEFNGMESRHWVPRPMPLRYANGEGQDLSEVVLGRFGSRFCLNPVPQLLGWRQSPLGTWSDDLSEMVLAFRSPGGEARCLPFTDRYPVFSGMHQETTMTGVSYRCSDPSLPFAATVTLTAPFYPQDFKLSGAPFFYMDVELDNPTGAPQEGEFLFARPHRYVSEAERPRPLEGDAAGYRFSERYNFADGSYAGEGCTGPAYRFEEAVALDDASGVDWHYREVEDSSWIWPGPAGYPLACDHAAFTWRPRGHSGFSWGFRLSPGGSARRTVVLAAHSPDGVMEVEGERDFSFAYNRPDGPGLTSLQAVLDYALGPERADIEARTAFFDGVLSEPCLSGMTPAGKGLAALGLQNYIVNAWWVSDPDGREWFAAWEGPPFYFMSTIDVEYNSAWLFLSFWPDLLERQLRQWTLFEREDGIGAYLSHDIGTDNRIIGMTYDMFGMEVEENADFILLLYAYWKQAGGTALVRELFPRVRGYAEYILSCDTDGDGLPDVNADNSIDQARLFFISGRNQTYLGVKAAAAVRAAADMAGAQEARPEDFIAACEARLQLVNATLREAMWRGDHFAVSSDPGAQPCERDACSIYPANGLLWLLASGGQTGLEPDNLERMRLDLVTADRATWREFGCVHTSGGDDCQWMSQNAWRDALGFYLEAEGWPEGQAGRLEGYWGLEHWWACNMNGGFWDSVFYREQPPREGPRRGAYECNRYMDQSLGYYSRGAAFLCLPAALARLRVDLVSGSVAARPSAPGRYPVFPCADWGAADPAARIPVLVFGDDLTLREILNPRLLPERPGE